MSTQSRETVETVSVIITTFNRAEMLQSAINSVLSQTYQAFELLIVDDGSRDHTADVVAQYQRTYGERIRYMFRENGGCAAARNTGITAATGKYIAFLDSDDTFEQRKLETEVGLLRNNCDCGFVYSDSIEMDVQSGIEWISKPAAYKNPDRFTIAHFMTNHARNGAVLFRRECLDKDHMFDETMFYNEDSDHLHKVALSFKACYSTYPGLRVRIHEGSKSLMKKELVLAELRSARKVIYENPEFSKDLGSLAQRRLYDLNAKLAVVTLLHGEFREGLTLLMRQGPIVTFGSFWRLAQSFATQYVQRLRSRRSISR